MLLHYMQALKLPKGVVKQLDKIRRGFFGKENATCKHINCLVTWENVCSLKDNGGLGVIDLRCQKTAELRHTSMDCGPPWLQDY